MAEYEMQKLTLPDKEAVLYPKMRLCGSVGIDRVAVQAARETTFAESEVKAIVMMVADQMACFMAQGYAVKIDGIGTFTPSLGLREGFERETGEKGERRRNAASICVRGVNFRADKELVAEVKKRCSLERSKRKFSRSSDRYTPAERLALAQRYLEQHGSLTVGDYCALTGLLRSMAARELCRWSADPETGIGTSGVGSHKIYVKKPVQP